MTKKRFLLFGTTIMAASAIASLIVTSNSSTFKASYGDEDVVWNHYSAVEATLDHNGIKEYWVSCKSHEHQFTVPEVAPDHIVDKGAPDTDFIDSLDADDDRLVSRHRRGFDFEDDKNPYISIKSGFESLEIVDGEGVNGSKCLRAGRSTAGDSFLRISKNYLDMIFADPNVKSLAFAAKAHNATNNFRHITVAAEYVNNNQNLISCFEMNNENWGVTTGYKTFYLTRGVYSQMDMSNSELDWFVKFGAGSVLPQYLYLDNFRICYTDYFDYSFTGLDSGSYFSGKTDQNVDKFGINYPDSSGRIIEIQGEVQNVGFDENVKTEGVRSFKFEKKSGYSAYYISKDKMLPLMGDNGYLTFDMYGTNGLNCGGAIITGMNHTFLSSNFPANKWVTITIPRSEITADGRFMILQWSGVGTYYIDNMRVNGASYSFEDNHHTSLYGDYGYVSHYDVHDASEGNTLRDATKDYIALVEWGGWNEVAITDEKASEGAYSLKLSTTSNYKAVRVTPKWFDLMDDDSTFSFDIYTDDMMFVGDLYSSVVQGEWCTVTFHKADFKDNAYRILSNVASETYIVHTGTMYLDNFVLVL